MKCMKNNNFTRMKNRSSLTLYCHTLICTHQILSFFKLVILMQWLVMIDRFQLLFFFRLCHNRVMFCAFAVPTLCLVVQCVLLLLLLLLLLLSLSSVSTSRDLQASVSSGPSREAEWREHGGRQNPRTAGMVQGGRGGGGGV